MNARVAIAAAAAALLSSMPAGAQPADLPIQAATTSVYPPGVSVGNGGTPVYVWQGRHTLYGMDMRTLLREGPNPALYCTGPCAELWAPLLAPADAKPNIIYPLNNSTSPDYVPNQKAPDWTVIAGPQGPQWVYKGWHMVFTRKGEAPGSAAR